MADYDDGTDSAESTDSGGARLKFLKFLSIKLQDTSMDMAIFFQHPVRLRADSSILESWSPYSNQQHENV